MATPDEFVTLVVRVADWMENMADQFEWLMPPLRDARAASLDVDGAGFARAENARRRILAALHEPIDVTPSDASAS